MAISSWRTKIQSWNPTREVRFRWVYDVFSFGNGPGVVFKGFSYTTQKGSWDNVTVLRGRPYLLWYLLWYPCSRTHGPSGSTSFRNSDNTCQQIAQRLLERTRVLKMLSQSHQKHSMDCPQNVAGCGWCFIFWQGIIDCTYVRLLSQVSSPLWIF